MKRWSPVIILGLLLVIAGLPLEGGPRRRTLSTADYTEAAASFSAALQLRLKLDGTDSMTGNLRMAGHWLSNDGGNEGIWVGPTKYHGIATNTPEANWHLWDADETVRFLIQTASTTAQATYDLYTGKRRYRLSANGNTETFDVQDLSSGTLPIRMTASGTVIFFGPSHVFDRGTTCDIFTEVTLRDTWPVPLEDVLDYDFTTDLAGTLTLTAMSGDAGMSCYVRGAANAVYWIASATDFEWAIASTAGRLCVVADGDGTYSLLCNRGSDRTLAVHYQGSK